MRVHRLLVVGMAFAALVACKSRRTESSSHEESPASEKDELSAQIQRSEQHAMEREGARACERPVAIYDGSITVNASDYVHSVARGEDFVEEPIAGLDKILTTSTRVGFTLDYPFERPLAGAVMADVTLRRTIDAIRAGFRQMYKDTTQRDIPGMYNKDVTGPFGKSFHVIDDLVIEGITLCADSTFLISIGS